MLDNLSFQPTGSYGTVTRVAGYVRVSSREQVENWSLAQQKWAIQEYCDNSPTCELVAIYADEGHSAWGENSGLRPEYQRLMADAKIGKMDLVVSTTIDRMARNTVTMIETVKTLHKYGVGYKSLGESFDCSGPGGVMTLTMFSAFAELYSSQLSAHVKRGLAQRIRNGLYVARPPFGYQICDTSCGDKPGKHGVCHIHKDKGPMVVEVFERCEAGTYSLQALSDRMNDRGFRTNGAQADRPGREHSGHRFTYGAVSKMMKKRFYTGMIEFKGQIYPGLHEPLISEELFERVQRILSRNASKYNNTGRKSKRHHLLAKLVRCHDCGTRLHGTLQGTQRNSYYRMPPRSATGPECHFAGRSFKGQSIEGIIEELFSTFQLNPEWKQYVFEKFLEDTNVESLEKRRAKLIRSKERINELYIEGEFERADRNARISVVNAELESTETLPEYAVEQAGEYLNRFAVLWEKASKEERNNMLRTVLDAIYIDCDKRIVHSIAPHRAFALPIRAMSERMDLVLVEAPEYPF